MEVGASNAADAPRATQAQGEKGAHPPPTTAAAAEEEEEHAELTTFQCRDAYVYRIPPASTIGHRAELWRVDDWDAVRPGPCCPHHQLQLCLCDHFDRIVTSVLPLWTPAGRTGRGGGRGEERGHKQLLLHAGWTDGVGYDCSAVLAEALQLVPEFGNLFRNFMCVLDSPFDMYCPETSFLEGVESQQAHCAINVLIMFGKFFGCRKWQWRWCHDRRSVGCGCSIRLQGSCSPSAPF